jgi:CSLREA domain-containing protein
MTSILRALALLAVALPLAGLLWLGQVALVHADGITVTSAADTDIDDGLCTLREAIINANNNDISGSADCHQSQQSH